MISRSIAFIPECEYIIKRDTELTGDHTEITKDFRVCRMQCTNDSDCLGFEHVDSDLCRVYGINATFDFTNGSRIFHVKLCSFHTQGKKDYCNRATLILYISCFLRVLLGLLGCKYGKYYLDTSDFVFEFCIVII